MTHLPHHLNCRFVLWFGALLAAGGCLTAPVLAQGQGAAAAERNQKPKLSANELRGIIQTELGRNSFYAPGNLLSRSDATSVFDALRAKGIDLSEDAESLNEDFLSENSPLVRLLKSPDGRKFMKNIVGDPTAYDRLERLSWTYDGRYLIEDLLRDKNGVKKFQQLKTKEQLAKFSKDLAADARTQDFALPTGRIHTADQLFERLDELLNHSPAE